MNTKTLISRQIELIDIEVERITLNRLLAAAVVSKKFCSLLLANPHKALETGFSDETFDLSPQTREILVSIHATSINEFASLLIDQLRWLRNPLIT
jgi:hypothetical protein